MFIILIYDVGVKRVAKVLKICRKYLFHIQKSVFEGMITESKLERLKMDLEKLIIPNLDQVKIYKFKSLKYASVEEFGKGTESNE